MSVKVNFVGRLGVDAETVTLPNQNPFISFRVAVNERVNKEDVTTWMTVTADYNRYQNMVKYLTKGSVVNVCGTERCTIYHAKNGQEGIERKVNADSLEFVNLGKKNSENNTDNTTVNAMTTGSLHTNTPTPEPIPVMAASVDDGLPF